VFRSELRVRAAHCALAASSLVVEIKDSNRAPGLPGVSSHLIVVCDRRLHGVPRSNQLSRELGLRITSQNKRFVKESIQPVSSFFVFSVLSQEGFLYLLYKVILEGYP
jgi:hypothetical protein